MATAVQGGQLLASVAGDQCNLGGERVVVAASCGRPVRSYGCLSCRTRLANAYQLELHTEHGTHVICRLCPDHGAEEWQPDDSTPATPEEATVATTTAAKQRGKKTAPTPAPTTSTAPDETEQYPETGILRRIPVANIVTSPYQPRREFDPVQITELANSMRVSGLLQPITVRLVSRDGRILHELVAGERRLRAAQQLQWTEIPAVVRQIDDAAAQALALVENLQRADLSPLEEARAILQLMRGRGLSQSAVAQLLGLPRSTVGDRLGLLEIGPWVDLLEAGTITVSQAAALRPLRGASEAVHESAIMRAKGDVGNPGALHVSAFVSSVLRWYSRWLYPLHESPDYPWHRATPTVDAEAHDRECGCGRAALRTTAAEPARDYCCNPDWWTPARDAAAAAAAAKAKGGADEAAHGGEDGEARPGAPTREWSDLGVKLQLPGGAGAIDYDGWGLPDGHVLLVGRDGRWDCGKSDDWDPADVVDRLAEDEIVAVRDRRRGGWLIATTATDVVETAQARWRARWQEHEHELRALEEADAPETYGLIGEGARALLLAIAAQEDDLLCEALTDLDQLYSAAVSDEVRAEVTDGYPGPVTTAWLRTAAIEEVEALASEWVRRLTLREFGDPVARQVADEEAAALVEIRQRSVPWVLERPALLGDQQELPDPADDEEGVA